MQQQGTACTRCQQHSLRPVAVHYESVAVPAQEWNAMPRAETSQWTCRACKSDEIFSRSRNPAAVSVTLRYTWPTAAAAKAPHTAAQHHSTDTDASLLSFVMIGGRFGPSSTPVMSSRFCSNITTHTHREAAAPERPSPPKVASSGHHASSKPLKASLATVPLATGLLAGVS
jgi:hypothetical protein